MKKAFILLSLLTIITLSNANAQKNYDVSSTTYASAIGIKFYPTAVSLKHFIIPEDKALEFLGFFYNEGIRFTGLYEIHSNIKEVAGLKWYVGPGAHIALYNHKHSGFTSVGIDGVIGLDYKINQTPVNVSLDYQPSIQLTEYYGDRFTSWGGLAIRYTF